MIDADTLMFRAESMPTKAVSEFAVTSVVDVIDSLSIERCVLRTDGEPAIMALAEAAKKRQRKHVDLQDGSLKHSSSMGA